MMNTLVQSMRSARKKKIKLTIIHQNLHPRVGLFTVQFIFSFVFCLFVYFPLFRSRLQMKSTRPSSCNLGPSNRSTRHPLHTERTSSTPKERANKMSTSVRIAAKNATNLAGFGLKLGITFISFLASCVPSLH
jgi:hypothetical protein